MPSPTTPDGDHAAAEPLHVDFAPWDLDVATPEQRAAQELRLDGLRARGAQIGDGCFVSELAAVHSTTLVLGDRSYVAAHAHVTGDVRIGADCSVNVGAAVRGRVEIGRAVRVGTHAAILGFNHGTDAGSEMFRQPLVSRGVMIGDDVWIGAGALVLDGVRIGSHSIVGAGAVVTKSVPESAVVVGNPGRVVRSRDPDRTTAERTGLEADLGRWADRARADVAGILERSFVEGMYRDGPAAEQPTVRAHCDAVELADLLLSRPPAQLSSADHVARLRAAQDRRSGLVAELVDGRWSTPPQTSDAALDQVRAYHVLSAGYALDLLGSRFARPVHAVAGLDAVGLVQLLEDLPWQTNAWGAGALVDAVGTALTWELRAGRRPVQGALEALVGWLATHLDQRTGLWGASVDGDREPVNGTYRLVRGTYAQWGLACPAPEALSDTVLRHAATVLDDPEASSCDALDVVHLLRWAARSRPGYRRSEVQDVAEAVAARLLRAWHSGAGLAFRAQDAPGLKGTEMGLATAWLTADLLGCADVLGYRPRGVHRPEPMLALPDELATPGSASDGRPDEEHS
jgi:acetyltransferase-like isoleucine patch superfamily enzyme